MYSGDHANMPNVDWVNHAILNGGCCKVVGKESLGSMERAMLTSINEVMSNKSLASCIFNLVNMKNPSGRMIGPGNCQWFHNIILRLAGTVGEDLQKLLKNHAVVHDACGFMLLHNDIGPGYIFGLLPCNVINVSSAGALRSRLGHWISTISAMGQLSGLTAMYYLMKCLTASFFNVYDD